MTKENRESLFEIYHSFLDEAESLEKEIHENELSITEAEKYIDNMYDSEPDDFKVFSPRNMLRTQKAEIDHRKELIEKMENNNKYLHGRLEKINSYILGLESVLREKKEETNSAQFIYTIQEKERVRIANNLHDLSLQNLTFLYHKTEIVSKYIDKDTVRAKLELATLSKQLKETIDDIRDVIFNLNPININIYGIKESIDKLVEKYKKINPNINYVTNIEDISIPDETIANTIFNFVQEAAYNAVIHSNGSNITIFLKKEYHKCYVSVKDDGQGFRVHDVDYKNAHFGIHILEERIKSIGGTFKIDTSDKGTEVSAIFKF